MERKIGTVVLRAEFLNVGPPKVKKEWWLKAASFGSLHLEMSKFLVVEAIVLILYISDSPNLSSLHPHSKY